MLKMFNIYTLNKIADIGLNKLGDNYNITDTMEGADGILVRSASMHELELNPELKAIARAGAGTNNIPVEKCAEKGIVVFNTPGANANAVKELVIAGLLIGSRDVIGGANWALTLKGEGEQAAKLVEKGKSNFVGPEITGKKLGVIGLGAIGVMVANAASALGMEVYGYDPFIYVDAAWHLSRKIVHVTSMSEIFTECDYITLHVPLNDATKHTINKETIATMKDGVRILNFARAALVEDNAMLEALESGKVAKYVTDFPTAEVIGEKNVVAIPHLGASTPESEDNCAVMAAKEIKNYLENGNIVNSVNFPNCEAQREGKARVCVFHKNIPAMLSQISNIFANEGLNILNMTSKSKGDFAYTMIDVSEDSDKIEDAIKAIDGIIRVRVIK